MAPYYRTDGSGGFIVADGGADVARLLESTLEYLPWIEFETHPVMTIEDAFPVIQSVYG